MSLVVVDPDEEASNSLEAQLASLEFDALSTSGLKAALEVCEHTLPELVCCSDFEWALELAGSYPRLPVVYISSEDPDADVLLAAIRNGIADVWQMPLEDLMLTERIHSVLNRARAAETQAETRLNAHLVELQRDQRAGRYIQMGMLPPNPMAIGQFRIRHRILPSLILSGDFVDYFQLTQRFFAFYIADVSGHGASSAFVTVLLKNFSRRLRREYQPSMLSAPGEILRWINRELLEQNIDKHAAMIFGLADMDENSLGLVNAGHFPPAILVSAADEPKFMDQRGKPVGLFDEVDYDALTVPMEIGDRLVMFSDGVLDAMGSGGLDEKEARLLDAAACTGMDAIWKSLGVNQRAAPDDMTCLTVKRER